VTLDLRESVEMDILESNHTLVVQDQLGRHGPKPPLHRKDYFIGIGLLMLVVILWTSSNFVTQDLYEGGYDKPFLITYTNTSAFSLYLIPFLIRRWWTRGGDSGNKSFIAEGSANEYQPLAYEEEHSEPSSLQPEFPLDTHSIHVEQPFPPLNNRQTADLAFTFCLIWFIANWSVNASLSYTSVASATILSSMSGFFTLGIGRLFKVERLTLLKIGAVVTSFLGVLIVSKSDSEIKPLGDPTSDKNIHESVVGSRATLGDALALISALFYAMYVILLKVRIKSESRIDMQLFFGFVGLFNVLVCWPIGVILHLTGAEIFELPSSKKVLSAMLINMAITLSSDYFYVLAMLKTTPLVVTIGLSLTIPVAVLGDFIRRRPTHTEVIIGALLVLCSFIAIGFEDSKEQVEVVSVSNTDEEL